MRKQAYATIVSLLALAGCGGGGGASPQATASDRAVATREQGKAVESAGASPWAYKTEVDKMTDRTIHLLSAIGESGKESYELTIKCDAAPMFLVVPMEETDIEWETVVDPGVPARRATMRFGSTLLAGVLTELGGGLRFAPQSPDPRFASLDLLLGTVGVADRIGFDSIDKKQAMDAAGFAFAGLAEVLDGEKLLLSGVHANEVIEFPAPKGDPNAAAFFSACRASSYKAFGIAPPHAELPATPAQADSAAETDVARTTAEKPAASGSAAASRFTMRVAADSLTPSESGDGFSFKVDDGREFYVDANADAATPGADLLVQAERNGGLVCITELDNEVVKVDAGACP